MILVDSSVWIDFFRGLDTSGALLLREILRQDDVLAGDLVLVEGDTFAVEVTLSDPDA